MEVVKQFIPQMEELLLLYGVKMDADNPAVVQLDILIDKIHMEMKNPEQMLPVIEAMSIRVDSYNKQQWDEIIKSVLGMPMRDIPFDRIVRQDAEADNTLREMWVAENLDYLKNVDEQTMQKIKQMLTGKIVGNVNRRELSKELIDEIEKITEFERNRAVLIARDQVGKLNGKLMEYRQTHAGITEYKWSSSHDQRVRPTHREYDGKIYTWGAKSPHPNPEGSPGMPIRCRCVAIPVIDLDKIVTKPVPQSYVQVQEYRPVNEYRPVTISETVDNYKRMELDIKARQVTSTVNRIFKSDSVTLKPKALHFIDNNISKTLRLLKVKDLDLFPKIVIISEQEMQNGAVAAYVPATNTLFLQAIAGDKEKLLAIQKDMVCPDNPLSTYIHEFLHWQDAMEYIKKHDKIDKKYFHWINEFCRLRLVETGRRMYNNISEYANFRLRQVPPAYDEVYTEYRTRQILQGDDTNENNSTT